ncbi:MAG: hypothetical protein M1818_004826 [Claussenomyces sp. TS43310]|nr:MAG: hypothetical protein M1818_004826 [Claussenomyces sp. TS43310]
MSDPDIEGFADHIFHILKTYEHPFVLVGLLAHRWMGCAGIPEEGFDMVIRAHQLPAIVVDLVKTGRWALVDADLERGRAAYQYVHGGLSNEAHVAERWFEHCCDADTVLRRVGSTRIPFEYLLLWSDETYKINIDTCPFVEVPELFSYTHFLVEEEQHPAYLQDNVSFWNPRLLSRAEEDGYRVIFENLPPTRGPSISSPILIPSIPAFLDALVYHTTRYKSSKPQLQALSECLIYNLTRYMYLEIPPQSNTILFQVEAETERYLEAHFARYKRKPRFRYDQW